MIVAVAVPSFPPQHSPIFGHFASSHTVAKLSDLTVLCNRSKFSFVLPEGAEIRNHSGLAGTFDEVLFVAEAGEECAADEFTIDEEEEDVGETKRVKEVSADSSSFLNSASRFRGAATLENKRDFKQEVFIAARSNFLSGTRSNFI